MYEAFKMPQLVAQLTTPFCARMFDVSDWRSDAVWPVPGCYLSLIINDNTKPILLVPE